MCLEAWRQVPAVSTNTKLIGSYPLRSCVYCFSCVLLPKTAEDCTEPQSARAGVVAVHLVQVAGQAALLWR